MRNVKDRLCRGDQTTRFRLTTFFRKYRHFLDNEEKYGGTSEVADYNIIWSGKDVICMPDK